MSSPSNTIIRGSSSLTSTHDKYLSESLKKIVDHYKEEMRPLARKELQLFARQPDLISAVYAAAMSEYPPGKRHSHQRRTSRHVLNDTYETLKHIDYSEFRNFHSLHSALQVIIGSTKGIGPLAVYDIAQRIGSYLGLEPERIYLHLHVQIAGCAG